METNIHYYIALLRRWVWLPLLSAIVVGGVAFFASRAQSPVYAATATLLIVEGDVTRDSASAITSSQRLAQSYVERLKNYEVLSEALASVGAEMDPRALAQAVSANVVRDSQLIRLTVEHGDPETAVALANTIPKVFAERNTRQQLERFAASKESLQAELLTLGNELALAEQALRAAEARAEDAERTNQLNNNLLQLRASYASLLQSYEQIRLAEARSLSNLLIDDAARAPQTPIRPRVAQSTLFAAVVGLMLGVGGVFLLEYADDTVKNPERLERATGLSTLGAVVKFPINAPPEALITQTKPRSPIAEAYRRLRTNIQFVNIDNPLRTLLVTSAEMGEGKSTTAANLAIVLAQTANRVILIDADWRRPNLHKLFGLTNNVGLTQMLLDLDPKAEHLRETAVRNLFFLPTGPLPPNPVELLGSARMRAMLRKLAEEADYVVIDTPPVLAVADALVLSRAVDGVLLVTNEKTRLPATAAAARQLRNVDASLAGAVINGVRHGERLYGYYNYEYKSDNKPEEGKRDWKRLLSQRFRRVV